MKDMKNSLEESLIDAHLGKGRVAGTIASVMEGLLDAAHKNLKSKDNDDELLKLNEILLRLSIAITVINRCDDSDYFVSVIKTMKQLNEAFDEADNMVDKSKLN